MKNLIWPLIVAVLAACSPAPDLTAPTIPTGLTAIAGNARVTLQWTPNSEADLEGYVLTWGSDAGRQTATQFIPRSSTRFELNGLNNGTPYYFALASRDQSANTSGRSAVQSATPLAPDTNAFTITESQPAFNASGVPLDVQIALTFNKPADPASLTVSSTDLTLGAATWNAANTTVRFATPALQPEKIYTIAFNARDASGNPLSGATTLQFTSLGAAPTLTSTPMGGATDVAITAKFTVRFSKPMDKPSVEAAFSSQPAIPCVWLWTDGDRTATCTPDKLLPYGTPIELRVASSARSAAGVPLASPYLARFTTAPDRVKPALVSTVPTDFQKDIPISSAIVLTFSEAMNRDSVEAAFQAQPAISCAWTWPSDSRARCQPIGNLEPNTSYLVTVASTATDRAGNALQAPYAFTFAVGDAPTVVLEVSPPSGAVDMVTPQITIPFSEAMDPITTQSAFGSVRSQDILNIPKIVPGSLLWNPAQTR